MGINITGDLNKVDRTVSNALFIIQKKIYQPSSSKKRPPWLDALIPCWWAVTVTERACIVVRMPTVQGTLYWCHCFQLSVLRSVRNLIGTTPTLLTQLIKLWAMTDGLFFDGPQTSHMILYENASMHPERARPIGLSLSYPSTCHIYFGPMEWYVRRVNLLRLLNGISCGLICLSNLATTSHTKSMFLFWTCHIVRTVALVHQARSKLHASLWIVESSYGV